MVYAYEYNGGDLCYPGTNVLRNKLDIHDLAELLRVEKEMSMARYFDLSTQGVTGDFSMGHLCAIHRYLFQDVYEWAGELRREDISRPRDSRLDARDCTLPPVIDPPECITSPSSVTSRKA